MKRLLGVVAVLLAVHAYADGGGVVCESMTPCRDFLGFLYEVPGLTFDLSADGHVSGSSQFWWSADCQGDPDNMMQLEADLTAGHWFADFDLGRIPDGTIYSIQWTMGGCSEPTACVNGVFGSVPDWCQ